MWYFVLNQSDLSPKPYQELQQRAALTEVELFNEPFDNLCLFEVERANYTGFVDFCDVNGLTYTVFSTRPTRPDLLDWLRG